MLHWKCNWPVFLWTEIEATLYFWLTTYWMWFNACIVLCRHPLIELSSSIQCTAHSKFYCPWVVSANERLPVAIRYWPKYTYSVQWILYITSKPSFILQLGDEVYRVLMHTSKLCVKKWIWDWDWLYTHLGQLHLLWHSLLMQVCQSLTGRCTALHGMCAEGWMRGWEWWLN